MPNILHYRQYFIFRTSTEFKKNLKTIKTYFNKSKILMLEGNSSDSYSYIHKNDESKLSENFSIKLPHNADFRSL